MAQQAISYADLSIINSALKAIRADMHEVNIEIGSINTKHDHLKNDLLSLMNSFNIFVEADIKHKSLQLAETRQGNLKQDLQIKFGYYAEVRRMATGILQAVDTGIVGDDTLRHSTEEVMIKAPNYWLAPALVVLASWIRDDKNTSEKALNESLKRDDYKTTLFFMLIMRRLGRNDACLQWMNRYFLHQNPHNLDREFIVILEAITTGIFQPTSHQLMTTNVKSWINQLTQTDNYIDKQKLQWISFFQTKGSDSSNNYSLLEEFATNWTDLKYSVVQARSHQALDKHFKNIFETTTDYSKATKVQLDEILSLLVTNFDDEELPLQNEVRLNQLIIQKEGDKKAAQALMNNEKHIFDEKVDFLQMLTNAAFDPELSGATKVTQALAVSISQPWIVEAHDTFTADYRNNVEEHVELIIDGFKTSTTDGTDETEQLNKHDKYWANFLENELKKLTFPTAIIFVGAIISILSLVIFKLGIIGIIGVLIGGLIIFSSINNHKKAKKKTIENITERKTKSKEVLRGCISETVDYRKEFSLEDAKAEVLRHTLLSITPEDFSSTSRDTRNILQTS
jgi:preprotein translocase subunit SecE